MDWTSLILFLPACFALNLAPGPNNLLAMYHAKDHGLAICMLAGIGRLAAFSVMITLAAIGLASVLYSSELLFTAIKIAGAGYLFYLAWQLWCADVTEIEQQSRVRGSVWQLARQEFLLAIGNPKAILIFTAFLPQFVDQSVAVGVQFTVLGGAFLLLEWLAIMCYGLFGLYLRQWFSRARSRQLFNRTSAAFLSVAGVGILMGRR